MILDRERLGYVYKGPVLDRLEIGARAEMLAWIARWKHETILISLDHTHLLAVPRIE